MTTGQILPASPIEPVLSLRNLRVSYGEREILHGISFDVVRGETLVILGGSGSGKSTLLRALVGLEKPTAGEIWIKGRDLAKISAAEMDEIRRKIGMSFQGGALFGSMTVGENVALPLREHTTLEDSTIEIILRLKLQQVGLEGFEYYTPAQLSGGMKKRAAVARAFLIADRMLLIDKGNIVALGTTEEMRSSTQPRVRQFLDRIAEPEVTGELDYLQMLTAERPDAHSAAGKRG